MKKTITPSQNPFLTFVLCPPYYVETKIKNNSWMDKKISGNLTIDHEKFLGEWWNMYEIMTANSLVFLLPPKKGLQDQTYVNSFVCLNDGKTIILSKFRAKGRKGEEKIAGNFLKKLGYNVIQSPYFFEGYPELKFSGQKDKKDKDIYYGGYGIRSEINFHKWAEKEFNIKIIKLREVDPFLYHLDCSLFVLNKDNVMVCTEMFTKKELKQIEKITKIHDVSIDSAYQGITNSIKIGDFVINASSLDYMKETDKWYKQEKNKNKELEKICDKVGLEIVYVSLSEAMKSGALASCFVTPLNYQLLI